MGGKTREIHSFFSSPHARPLVFVRRNMLLWENEWEYIKSKFGTDYEQGIVAFLVDTTFTLYEKKEGKRRKRKEKK